MTEFKNPPIQRHEVLAPFSRDHYVGLVQARHLLRAADGDDIQRRRAVAEFVDAWRNDIRNHFEDEERVLLSLMPEADQRRMLSEHRRLAELSSCVHEQRKQIAPDPALLRDVGSLLERHIRWEERELFKILQDRTAEANLAALRIATAEIESSRNRKSRGGRPSDYRQEQYNGDSGMVHKINPTMTVGELVREQPARSRVFESLKIDYCCGGKQPLEHACVKHGLDIASVVERLEGADAMTAGAGDFIDPDAMSLSDLVDHIERDHHAYLRNELPRLDTITEKVHRVHGQNEPRLADVRRAFCSLRDELMSHMVKEERVLFPIIRALEHGDAKASRAVGTIANPIRQMESEHHDSGDALATMHTLTDGYTPPTWACNTYRAMLDGLAQLERDMHQHVHKENNVLFPKAIELERQLLGNGGA